MARAAGVAAPLLAILLAVAVAAAPAPARRVVSLNPSLTAILVAVGARDALVGVDDYSAQQQPAVADLPRVGGLSNPSLEAVVALHPDLVVLVPSVQQRDFRQRLHELRIPVLALNPVSFDDVLASIETLGRRVGHGKAARARVAAIRRTRREIEAATRSLPRVPTVLVLQRDPLYVVGPGSFVDEMLRSVGARNLAESFTSPYPRASREWLIAAAPQVLIDSSGDPEPAARYWAQWPSLPAVKHGRVVSLAQGAATLPGPHLDRALRLLARAVHGPGVLRGLAKGGG